MQVECQQKDSVKRRPSKCKTLTNMEVTMMARDRRRSETLMEQVSLTQWLMTAR